MPGKESITAVTIGNGWIAIATSKQLLRLFTIGGVQREVISIPGHVTTLAGWGPRLSIVYQVPPCEYGEGGSEGGREGREGGREGVRGGGRGGREGGREGREGGREGWDKYNETSNKRLSE